MMCGYRAAAFRFPTIPDSPNFLQEFLFMSQISPYHKVTTVNVNVTPFQDVFLGCFSHPTYEGEGEAFLEDPDTNEILMRVPHPKAKDHKLQTDKLQIYGYVGA